jgi:DMSO/TMAO reductase YedYZ molybdopterin-dependent catalytic subunit
VFKKNSIFIALLCFCLAVTGCRGQNFPSPIEIREYQGQKLSSINDLHENSIKGPQQIDIRTYRLKITGSVATPKTYTYDEIIDNHAHYQKVQTLDCVEDWSVNLLWEGVLVRDLLNEAGVNPSAAQVIFHCQDGFTTNLPVDYFMKNDIIMAYKMNEAIIPPERGYPFEVVAEGKWGYKWAKWITEIELTDNAKYRGYWESGGYSNSGDLDKSKYELPIG